MNVHQIEVALSQKISASSTNFDLLAASKALQLLRTNGVFVVGTSVSLPSAVSNEGKIYFIEDIETVVWSNGTNWLRLLDKTPFTQLWAWGIGQGQLGDGSVTTRCSPVREFCSATNWCWVSGGGGHTAAIKTSGQLWVWGNNSGFQSCGRLGDGTTTDRCSPVREFCSATDWCGVSAGNRHTAAIKTSGQIWSWGYNGLGRLGDGTAGTARCSPVREFCSAIDWCVVNAGGGHTAAIKTSGQSWAWGTNSNGQLGDGTTVDKCSPVREICSATDWCGVSAGSIHTTAVKTSGQIWAWGGNGSYGRLGDGTTVNKCSPVQEFCSATDWCGVSAGNRHTAAIKTSGQIWSWGSNNFAGISPFGSLGNGSTVNSCSPVREFCSATDWCQVSVSYNHAIAIKTSGQIWAWGSNSCGQLGDGSFACRCSPVREISSSTDWRQVSAGQLHTAAIKIV